MSRVDYATEKPYVLATRADARKGDFYTAEAARAAVPAKGFRRLYGRHQGHWKHLASFKDGVRLKELE